jgi:hypothetical protein
MPTTTRPPTSGDHCDHPTYWFALLEIAREHHDFEKAAQAIRELRRLGVRVIFKRPATRQEGSHVRR